MGDHKWVNVAVVDVVFSNEASSIIMKNCNNGKNFLIHTSIEMGSILLDIFQKHHFKRPNTFTLLSNCITSLGGDIRAIVIDDAYEGIFFAKIVIDQNGTPIQLDARPSDAIALAVVNNMPIVAESSLLEKLTWIDTSKVNYNKANIVSSNSSD